jgi:hypothetical protein
VSVEITIRGAGELRRVAAQLRAEQKALQANIVRGARRAVRPLERAIRAEVPAHMPGGYTAVLAPALRITTSVRFASSPGIRIRVRAAGKVEDRDVASLDAGVLRHPLFGNRGHWYAQGIRAGFVSGPARALADDVYRELNQVAEDVRQRIERG